MVIEFGSGIDPAFYVALINFRNARFAVENKSALITQLTEGKLSPAYVQHFAKVRSLTPRFKSHNSGGKGTQHI